MRAPTAAQHSPPSRPLRGAPIQQSPRVCACASQTNEKEKVMMSIVFFLAFAGSASAFTVVPPMRARSITVIAPRLVGSVNAIVGSEFRQEKLDKSFECGVCGGASDWCPVCRGPAARCEEQAELDSMFGCEVCGGASDWCPVCRGPVAKSLLSHTTPRLS